MLKSVALLMVIACLAFLSFGSFELAKDEHEVPANNAGQYASVIFDGYADSIARAHFLDTLALIRNLNPALVSVTTERLNYTTEEYAEHYHTHPSPFSISEFSYADSILTIKLMGVHSGGQQFEGNVMFRHDSLILYYWSSPLGQGVLSYFKQEVTYKIKMPRPQDTLVKIVGLDRFVYWSYMKSPEWDSVKQLMEPTGVFYLLDHSLVLNRDSCSRMKDELLVTETSYVDSVLYITIEGKTRLSWVEGNAFLKGNKIILYYWSGHKKLQLSCTRFRYLLDVPQSDYEIELRELKM